MSSTIAVFPRPRKNDAILVAIRNLVILAYAGESAARLAPIINAIIGPDRDYAPTVSIPFITKKGTKVSLFGGHIHCNDAVSWDILDHSPWGDYDDSRFPDGLTMLPTVDLLRILRSL